MNKPSITHTKKIARGVVGFAISGIVGNFIETHRNRSDNDVIDLAHKASSYAAGVAVTAVVKDPVFAKVDAAVDSVYDLIENVERKTRENRNRV